MGRVNKFTTGVFTNIVGTTKNIPEFEQFLNVQDLLAKPSEELKKYLESYRTKTIENKPIVEYLAHLEDVIMQIRTRDNLLPSDIKLYLVRDYIYGRITFHRKDKDTDELRVIAGQTKEYGTNLNKLYQRKKFMNMLIKKFKTNMNEIIEENVRLLELSNKELIHAE